ncbi:hypothetical protein VNO77_42060 [Canavalia gladiata]|uniref:Uncharacterized protein n=1 Tax=Canavalia gladiata TaxID=3824 RepID=A0AAN9K3F0_CANGL
MNTMASHHCSWPLRVLDLDKGSINKVLSLGYCGHYPPSRVNNFGYLALGCHHSAKKCGPIFSGTMDDNMNPSDHDADKIKSRKSENEGVDGEMLRENLEKIVGMDDSTFTGFDLATLIRNKYGRSYDVQLVKKEFMGRNLLALNVMWKYMEQRSFPLTEEEYIMRLDDVADTLKCWGAVSHIRNSLAKSKERPRIGKVKNHSCSSSIYV